MAAVAAVAVAASLLVLSRDRERTHGSQDNHGHMAAGAAPSPIPTGAASNPSERTAHDAPASGANDADADLARALAYKNRLGGFAEVFDKWVRENDVTPEKERKVLLILADAQRVYDESAELRQQLGKEAHQKRDARMTLEQRAAREAAIERYALSLKRPNNEEREAASTAFADAVHKVSEELEASAPPDEEAAFEAAVQVERDLNAEVEANLSEFLTPRQLETFFPASFYLNVGYNNLESQEYAKTVPSHRRAANSQP